MTLLLVVALQWAMGAGLARRVGAYRGLQGVALALLLGLPASSVVLLLMDAVHIPLTFPLFLAAALVAAALFNLDWLRRPRKPEASAWLPGGIALYEWPAILILVVFCAVSLWRCLLLPVAPRDAIVGMDLVAKFAVAEHTLNSSVFTGEALRGQLSNQPYYAPFVALMQIIYRWVLPFGKLWIGILFTAFTVFFYGHLKTRVHALLAGFLTVSLISTQGLFTYAFLVVTDMVNAFFFALSVLFTEVYRRSPNRGALLGASWFMAFACWSRSEMILILPLGAALMWWFTPRETGRLRAVVQYAVWPLVLFLVWHGWYFYAVFSNHPEAGFAGALPGAGAVLTSLGQLVNLAFVSKLMGTLPTLFVAGVVADVVVTRRLPGGTLLMWMAGVILMLLFVIHTFPAASMEYTGKRGFLKVLPLMALYLAESPVVARLGGTLAAWGQPRRAPAAGSRKKRKGAPAR